MKSCIVGLWQASCSNTRMADNFASAADAIEQASRARCRFLCLPETFLTGYGSRAVVQRTAIHLTDRRLTALARHAARRRLVLLAGLNERRSDGAIANTMAVFHRGRLVGAYAKTMLTGGDQAAGYCIDDALPVFHVAGLRFGIIICHDSSFAEVAGTLVFKGARLIFSPHFNAIPADRMDEHRIIVRNNHIGIAAHNHVVVARANVIVTDGSHDKNGRNLLGYGDSAIFSPTGQPLAEAGLFRPALVTADVAPYLTPSRWRHKGELRQAILDQWHAAASAYIATHRKGQP